MNSSNATLQSLDLRFNKIEDERTAAIAEALKTSNLTLQVMTDAVGETLYYESTVAKIRAMVDVTIMIIAPWHKGSSVMDDGSNEKG